MGCIILTIYILGILISTSILGYLNLDDIDEISTGLIVIIWPFSLILLIVAIIIKTFWIIGKFIKQLPEETNFFKYWYEEILN